MPTIGLNHRIVGVAAVDMADRGAGVNGVTVFIGQPLSEVHAAFHLAEHHTSLLKRILAWQQVLYSDPGLPPWIQDVLVNNLHLITEVGMWAQAQPPIGDWCRTEDGLWGLNECPRGCPQIECGGNSYWGGMSV